MGYSYDMVHLETLDILADTDKTATSIKQLGGEIVSVMVKTVGDPKLTLTIVSGDYSIVIFTALAPATDTEHILYPRQTVFDSQTPATDPTGRLTGAGNTNTEIVVPPGSHFLLSGDGTGGGTDDVFVDIVVRS